MAAALGIGWKGRPICLLAPAPAALVSTIPSGTTGGGMRLKRLLGVLGALGALESVGDLRAFCSLRKLLRPEDWRKSAEDAWLLALARGLLMEDEDGSMTSFPQEGRDELSSSWG